MDDWSKKIRKVTDYKYEIPKSSFPGMKVPGVIYAGPEIFEDLLSDDAPAQVVNVAMLPGVIEYSLAMPDIHYGYGFPIGGVAAMSVSDGVISPGGVGFDINCGVRLLSSGVESEDVRRIAPDLCADLFKSVPSGVGSRGSIMLDGRDMEGVLENGARWAVKRGIGWEE
ncbi:MAG TPA: RtcB family protein, partial [bacterium]|nr:RtcB family protein [bacterium]